MAKITTNFLPPLAVGKDTALRGVSAPPRFRPHPAAGSHPAASPNSPAPAPARAAGSERPAGVGEGEKRDDKLREAAQQFEAFFIGYLMKGMRKGGSVLAPSQGEKLFREMMDDELARSMSRAGQLGIADLLIRQLSPQPGKATEGNEKP